MSQRILKGTLIALAGLVLTVLLLLLWLFATASGTSALWSVAKSAVPALSAESLEGRLAGPLSLRGLRYVDEYREVAIASVDFDWRPMRLLAGTLQVKQLVVEGVDFTQLKPAPPPPEEEPFELPEAIEAPVDVLLEGIALHDISLRGSAGAEPLVIDSAVLAATFRDYALSLQTLKASGPLFMVEARAEVETRDGYPADAGVDWTVRPPELAPASGHLVLRGGLQAMTIEHRIEAPYQVVQTIELRDLLTALQVDARTELQGLQLAEASDSLPELALSGEIVVQGGPADLGFNTRLDADSSGFGAIALLAKGQFREQVLQLETLQVDGAEGMQLRADGSYDLKPPQPVVDMQLQWEALRWPLVGPPQLRSARGEATVSGALEDLQGQMSMALNEGGRIEGSGRWQQRQVNLDLQWRELSFPLEAPRARSAAGRAELSGTLDDYELLLQTGFDIPGQAGGEIAVRGQGDTESLALSRLELALLSGRLEGSGRVRWAPELQGSVQLEGEGLDPSVLLPEYPGKLRLRLNAAGGIEGEVARGRVDTLSLTGELRERPLDLSLQGSLNGPQLDLQQLELRAGDSRLSARGSLGDALDLDWRLNSDNLEDLLPQAAGALQGEGHLGGTPELPALRASLQAQDLQYQQYGLQALQLEADVDLERPAPSDLALSVDKAALGAVTVNRLELTGSGTRARHQLRLVAATSEGDAELGVEGDLQRDAWLLQVQEGRLAYRELAPWTLATPHRARIAADEQTLDRGCWRSGEARLCLEGENRGEQRSALVDLDTLGLDYIKPLLPEAISLQGELSARASVEQQSGAEPTLQAEVAATGVRLLTAAEATQTAQTLLALRPSSAQLAYSAAGLDATLSLPFENSALPSEQEGGIRGYAKVEKGQLPLAERPLKGQVDLDLPDIAFLTALSPEIEQAVGALRGAVTLAGTLGEPQPEGSLALSDGSLQLATPGVKLQDIQFQARSEGLDGLSFEGGARSGGGTLSVSGSASLAEQQTVADIAIEGTAFRVLDTPDARVFLSPDLAIRVRDSGVKVSGEVQVPRAEITPRKLPESAVSASSDQVIIREGEEAAPAVADSGVEADIRITLGDEVSVDGFGFSGRLAGSLVVRQEPGRPTVGTGELDILDGEYRAYGQGLVIEQGKILFAGGPLDQPGINVRAVRRPAEGILVGLRVRGPAQQPEIDIFSEPAMGQTEQLSWLVLGRPLQGTSEGEGDMLATAATMLGLKGGNALAERFGGNLGVDSIGFETGSGEAGAASDIDQAAFVIGKYLSPDLYVSYGIGLFESVSTIKLEYSLDENWKLSTESSTAASGGDVIYTIER